MLQNKRLNQWVEEIAQKTRPDKIVWLEGTEPEYQSLIKQMLRDRILVSLDQKKYPKCYLHRSNPNDVARTEHLTFICTPNREDVGPTNNWMHSEEAKKLVGKILETSMMGRTMYVVPYLMGPPKSNFSQVGVQITDSAYVVANLHILTRTGKIALEHLGDSDSFVKGVHSLADLNQERRFICHLPDENLILSVGSGYGGNALLSKKCHSLRIASVTARKNGTLAEHMLIIGVEDHDGAITYMAGAFPSASGKTNMAMLKPTAFHKRWRIWTVGDDIAWFHIGSDGRFWAINPEAGFFGVVPGTSRKTNPNAVETMTKNTIFTNVALTVDGDPWWEGLEVTPPPNLYDWRGNIWKPSDGPAAHPNARFTAPAAQCPSISPRREDPEGVPVSAILFGGRRANLVPLVYQSFNWIHGVFVGVSMAAETTAAMTGKTSVLRRDPMAMLPFCGYNMADYFRHWIDMGRRASSPPKIFCINWFRKGRDGSYLWPGYAENIRVLKWIKERANNRGEAVETPIGYVPTPQALDLDGLDLAPEIIDEMLSIDRVGWLAEAEALAEFFKPFGDRLPQELWKEHSKFLSRLDI